MSRTNSYCSWWKLVLHLTQKGDSVQYRLIYLTADSASSFGGWMDIANTSQTELPISVPPHLPACLHKPASTAPFPNSTFSNSTFPCLKPATPFFLSRNIFDAFHFLQPLCVGNPLELSLQNIFRFHFFSSPLLLLSGSKPVLYLTWITKKKKRGKKTFHSYIFKKEYNRFTMVR